MSEAILKLENVTKIFRLGLLGKTTIKAVDRVNLDIIKGEILGILGESGSGKSTIAKLLLKIYEPTYGRILFKGKDIRIFKGSKKLKDYYMHVQGVFQDPYASFNPRRRVLSTLMDTVKNYYPKLLKEDIEKVIMSSLEKVGLNIRDVVGRYPHEFSGGQLQRLSIARALLVNPEVIIADEPVSMVDASTRIDILNIFIDLKEREGLTLAIIGHDLGLTRYVSDRVVVLYRGQVVEEGVAEILSEPAHPYTKMLAESIPRIDKRWESKIQYGVGSIELGAKGVGCVFADRCPYRLDICTKKEPEYVDMGKSRVKCWLYTSK
ncbi:MAG: ABC transporter ATP-binding protein [Ignisphaera sp.]